MTKLSLKVMVYSGDVRLAFANTFTSAFPLPCVLICTFLLRKTPALFFPNRACVKHFHPCPNYGVSAIQESHNYSYRCYYGAGIGTLITLCNCANNTDVACHSGSFYTHLSCMGWNLFFRWDITLRFTPDHVWLFIILWHFCNSRSNDHTPGHLM